MARLTKIQSALQIKVQNILSQDVLNTEDIEFVLSNFHEAATNNISVAGAFFTPLSLALEFAEYCCYPQVKRPLRILDLCAGIGVLSYTMSRNFDRSPYNEKCEITCVEINADYIEVGKKILPQANWVQLDVTDIDAIMALGKFDLIISNPPYGQNVFTFKNKEQLCYTGSNAVYSVIEIASLVGSNATFIIPQKEAGFKYSGEASFTPYMTETYKILSTKQALKLCQTTLVVPLIIKIIGKQKCLPLNLLKWILTKVK